MTTTEKTCFKCGALKPRTDFYRHGEMADGLLGKCKDCTKADVKQNRADNPERLRIYELTRKHDPKRVRSRRLYAFANSEAHTIKAAAWAQRNADKRAAQIAVGNAVRDGHLLKEPCCVCGSTERVHGHHEDYEKPLNVVWLCPKHHAEYHAVRRSVKRVFGAQSLKSA